MRPNAETVSPDMQSRPFAAVPVERVISDELRHLPRSRSSSETSADAPSSSGVYNDSYNARLIGVSLSGGGIRSATLNLGVLQVLARSRLLPLVDYISTVSGGGYIGAFLSSLIRRKGLEQAMNTLDTSAREGRTISEPPEIQHLRDYSSYLTPKRGVFSADFWTMVVTYLRNFSLNMLILILALSALLLSPRVLIDAYALLAYEPSGALWLVLAILMFVLVNCTMTRNLKSLTEHRDLPEPEQERKEPLQYLRPAYVYWLIILPVYVGTILLNGWLWSNRQTLSTDWWKWAAWCGPTYAVLWLVGSLFGTHFRDHPPAGEGGVKRSIQEALTKNRLAEFVRMPERGVAWNVVSISISGLIAGAVGGIILMWLSRAIAAITTRDHEAALFGVPLITFVFMIVATLQIGLAGRSFSEEAREWWSRLGASFYMITIAMVGLMAITLYGVQVLEWAIATSGERLAGWVRVAISSGWVMTTLAGILIGKSPRTKSFNGNMLVNIVGKVAPVVFIVGLLLILEWSGQELLGTFSQYGRGRVLLMESLCVIAFFVGAVLLSRSVGVNDFSMNAFYRNRLVRCFLGATNPGRNANPFTDFDPDDDSVTLKDLSPDRGFNGPIPIINASLNLTQGEKLAWQQRKATSFIFSPFYCGYEPFQGQEKPGDADRNIKPGYRPTAGPYADYLTLGDAMAISGAAASPNMGYHTSAPLAFLMTIFNVRLGWWIENPKYAHRADHRYGGPQSGLLYLMLELFGRTTDQSRYVYLSDGGHFENLGLYELVRRRCRLIIAADAGEDPDYRFSDLANAIEKCRVDLGAEITLDTDGIRPGGEKQLSERHWVLGTIRYREGTTAQLLYLKSSLTGREPVDVSRYKAQNEKFPHQSTTDQFFDESQFESYRVLGTCMASDLMRDLGLDHGGPLSADQFIDAVEKYAGNYPDEREQRRKTDGADSRARRRGGRKSLQK